MRTSVALLVTLVTPIALAEAESSLEPENVTVPIAVIVPAIGGPHGAKHWLDSLIVKTKNVSHLDPMPVKRFSIMVPSDGWTNANFHADFTGGSATGFSRLTRKGDCTIDEETNALIECKLSMKNLHIKLKAEVKGDVFIPTVHPLATTSSFSESFIILQLKQRPDNSSRTGFTYALHNATLSEEPSIETSIIGTLSLSTKRLRSFRVKLTESLLSLLQDDLLSNYAKALNALIACDA